MLYSGQSIGIKHYTEQLIKCNTTTQYTECYVGNAVRSSSYDVDELVGMYLNQIPDDVDGVHIQYDTNMFKGDGDDWDQLENFVKFLNGIKHKQVFITLHGELFNLPKSYKLNTSNILYNCLKRCWIKNVIPAINKHTVIVHTEEHAQLLKTQGVDNPVVQLPSLPEHTGGYLSECPPDKIKIIINPGRHTDREDIHMACEVYKQLMDDTRYELYFNVDISTDDIDPELDGHLNYINFDIDCYKTYINQLKQFDVAIVTYKQDQAAPFSGVIWDCIGAGLITLTTNTKYQYMCSVTGPWNIYRLLNRLTTSIETREHLMNVTYSHIYKHTKYNVDSLYTRIYNHTLTDSVTERKDDNRYTRQDMLKNKNNSQFGRMFCKFVDAAGVSKDIYSEDKLNIFCDMMHIKNNERYTSLCEDRNLMHSYVCFLRTDQLINETQNITPPVVSNRAVVIPEDRILPHLEFHILNAMLLLPGYTIKIVCTLSAVDKMKVFCQQIHDNIQVISANVDKFTQNTYNDMMLSADFWQQFDEEHLLIYQQDSILFRQGIDEFEQYDYVGAPWPMSNTANRIGVGNGGFSLRRKSIMLKCLDVVKPQTLRLDTSTERYMDNRGLWNPPEDVYYSRVIIDNKLGQVASREVANNFSQESVFSTNPLGGHQYWLANEYIDTARRKNVLVVDDKIPLKSDGQGHARAEVMLQKLKDVYNVTLYPTNQTQDTCDERVEYYKSLGIRSIVRSRDRHGDAVPGMLSNYIKYHGQDYDIILISRPHNLQHIVTHLKKDLPIDKIVYDAEALFYERAFLKHEITGTPSLMECEKQKRQELDLITTVDNIMVVSQHEKDKILDHAGGDSNRINVYGHSMETSVLNKSYSGRSGLFFLGAFVHDDSPNTDAIIYFVNEVLPLVRQSIDNCKLYIGGYKPTQQVYDLANDHVQVLGFVEDPTIYYRDCRLFVCPHRFAAGIPWKVSEAMANGLPVVGTSLIQQQMCVDESIMRGSSDPEGIAADIIDLYTNETKWTTTRNNAIEHISKTHNPEIINTNLTKYLNEI